MQLYYKLGISVGYKYLLNERQDLTFNNRHKNNLNYFYGGSKNMKPS